MPAFDPPAFDTMVFDLDGTLVDTAPDLTAALNHVLDAFGRPAVTPASVRAMVGHGARRLIERGLAVTGGAEPALVDAGVPLFLEHYRANIARLSTPFPGTDRLLAELSDRGIRLAICTNKPESLACALVGALGWSGRFSAILGADSRPWKKPDPRHLLDTIAEAGGTQALFVGDSRTDAETAAAAGIPFVLVTFGYAGTDLEQLPADCRIDHFDALVPALPTLQAIFRPDPLSHAR